ncbi:MAG: TIGR04255 family protein [Legionellales bacterium]|nr:TIGR04255 family protein [Legionellales bacterium]
MNMTLKNPPVFYTLAQIKFNTIAHIDKYIPDIQDSLRHKGYPEFVNEKLMSIEVRDSQKPDISSQEKDRWKFSNFSGTEGYLLLSNSLMFHTTSYNSFEDFLDKLISGISLIDEIIELAYVERIGLRYLNAIAPKDTEQLENYLSPALLGFSSLIKGELSHSFIETVFSINHVTLVARALTSKDRLALPPDLYPLQLKLSPRFLDLKGYTTTLDIDAFLEERQIFTIPPLKESMLTLHKISKVSFQASVTDYARNEWS